MAASRTGARGEEQLIPVVRSLVAKKLVAQGFRIREISGALRISQPAVIQYVNGKRGRGSRSLRHASAIIDPLSEKIAKRIRSGQGGIETAELLDAAHHLLVMSGKHASLRAAPPSSNAESVKLLKERLQLELKAAEKYLDMASRTSDEHTKLLLRLIASDSIKHGDIASQIISWLEIQSTQDEFKLPEDSLLEEMISLEDSATEVNLRKSVKTVHPIARLLLEWIDRDEEKHEQMVRKIMRLRS